MASSSSIVTWFPALLSTAENHVNNPQISNLKFQSLKFFVVATSLVEGEFRGFVGFGVEEGASHGVALDAPVELSGRRMVVLVDFCEAERSVGVDGAGDVEGGGVELRVAYGARQSASVLLEPDDGGGADAALVGSGYGRERGVGFLFCRFFFVCGGWTRCFFCAGCLFGDDLFLCRLCVLAGGIACGEVLGKNGDEYKGCEKGDQLDCSDFLVFVDIAIG